MKKPKQTIKSAAKKAPAGKSPLSAVVNTAENEAATKAKMEGTERLPTMFELAQIAAALVDKKDLRQFEPFHHQPDSFLSITDAALGLWQNCGHTLKAAMKFDATLDLMLAAPVDEGPQPPEWFNALDQESFPIGFDRGLEIIFGPQSRTADQYKGLRDFLTAFYRNVCMDDSLGDAEAQKKFMHLKGAGFSKMEFEEYARGIHEMKHEQTQEKAKKAAAARWGKKKSKK